MQTLFFFLPAVLIQAKVRDEVAGGVGMGIRSEFGPFKPFLALVLDLFGAY